MLQTTLFSYLNIFFLSIYYFILVLCIDFILDFNNLYSHSDMPSSPIDYKSIRSHFNLFLLDYNIFGKRHRLRIINLALRAWIVNIFGKQRQLLFNCLIIISFYECHSGYNLLNMIKTYKG